VQDVAAGLVRRGLPGPGITLAVGDAPSYRRPVQRTSLVGAGSCRRSSSDPGLTPPATFVRFLVAQSRLEARRRLHVPPADQGCFHDVAEGRCWLPPPDGPPLRLDAGDLVLMASGAAGLVTRARADAGGVS